MKYPVTASRLSEIMETRGIIAQELADKTGIHKSSISQYVNGSHTPSIKNAAKMAKVLNVAPAWLKGFDVSMELPTPRGQVSYADIVSNLKNLDMIQLESLRDAIEKERSARYTEEIQQLKQQLAEGRKQ